MASIRCLRCLPRPSAVAAPRAAAPVWLATASFSTTTPAAADASNHIRAGKKMKLGKFKRNKKESMGKPPQPGERKAYRKKIQLSNNNALPVPGLKHLSAENIVSKESAGSVLALPDALIDQLRTIEAFKPTQPWGMFRQPSVLVRAETVDLANRMNSSAAKKETLRLVINGERLSGKSLLLLEAMANAYMNNWIVVNIPEAQELTTACTEYSPIPNTNPVQYMQHAYALKIVQGVRKANEKILSKLKLVHKHPEIQYQFTPESTVLDLANQAREAETAWPTFLAVWKELMTAGEGRPPILFSLDGLSHVMKMSDYRSPAYEPVHSHDLMLVRMFCDCLSGATPLPNGGAVVTATTRGNSPRSPSMELALSQRLAEQEGTEAPKQDPFNRKYDQRVEDVLKTVQVMKLDAVSRAEARAIMEYWAASGLLRTAVDEAAVSEKWTMGGNGNLGEIERASLLTMRL